MNVVLKIQLLVLSCVGGVESGNSNSNNSICSKPRDPSG